VHGSELVWAKGFGLADLDRGRPVEPSTFFRVASITKLFTASAVMLLRDEGALALDDAVRRYVPELPEAGTTVTLRHMLCHGSGLQREAPGEPGWTTGRFLGDGELLASLGEAEFMFPPMDRWKYSNLAYNLLGIVIERVSDRPYGVFVSERILHPLGMSDATFDPSSVPEDRRAVGYMRIPDQDALRPDPRAWDPIPEPAGGLCSTAVDLARFASFLMGDRVGPLSPSTLEEMRRLRLVADEEWAMGHGLGPMLVRDGSTVLVGHAGGLPGHAGWMLTCPESHVGAICLTNVGDGDPLLPIITTMLRDAAQVLAREEPEPPSAAPPEVAEILGRYASFGQILTLTWRGGRLLAEAPAREGLPTQRPMELRPEGRDAFRFVGAGPYVGEVMRIRRAADGRIVGFDVCAYPYERL
jgi:CubicO group peptidase (beta-lactamase class C family)